MKSKNSSIKTILIISVGFAIVYLISKWQWALIVSVSVGVLGILSERISRLIEFLWMKLAKILSYIIPNILLTLIFYLFLFPISLLWKLFGSRDSLNLRNEPSSLWKPYDKHINKEYFERIW